MADQIFDHEKLDVYRLAIEYVAETFRIAKDLSGLHRHSRDQWLRAAQSIPLNIAEGNGKRSLKDHSRFFDIGRACGRNEPSDESQAKTNRGIVDSLAMRSDHAAESPAWYDAEIDYEQEHEHRCAEHEL